VISGTGGGTGGGNGTGNGTGTGSGTGTGAGDCDPTATNYLDCILGEPGEAPGHPQGDAQSFGEAASNFSEGVSATPIGQLATSLVSVIPASGGQCPTPGFEIFGQHFDIDMHCTLYAQVAGMLSALMIVVYSIIGIRIILSS
jgi:hypothetical protein